MKELLTKSFWRGVKKTFDDALEEPSGEANASHTPEDNPKDSLTSEIPPSTSATSDQI